MRSVKINNIGNKFTCTNSNFSAVYLLRAGGFSNSKLLSSGAPSPFPVVKINTPALL